MSDYENHRGRIQKLNVDKESFMKSKLDEINVEHDRWGDLEETFADELSKEFIIVNNEIWNIYEDEEPENSDFYMNMIQLESGIDNYSFDTRFYNGGTCLAELLEEEIIKL